MLNRDKATVSKDLNSLIDKKVLLVVKPADFSTPRTLSINKDYTQWISPKGYQLKDSQHLKKYQLNSCEIFNSTDEESSTNKENTKENLNKYTASDFEKFWAAYPTDLGEKGSKKNAKKEFLKLNPSVVSLNDLLSAIISQANHKRSLIAKKEFAPKFQHVERWLKNERWNDEILTEEFTPNNLTFNPVEVNQ